MWVKVLKDTNFEIVYKEIVVCTKSEMLTKKHLSHFRKIK